MNTSASAAAAAAAAPFTAAQWVELEHQALIFKYLMAGVPVPPDLLIPIRRSFDSIPPSAYYHHSSLGYHGYYGKKLDPEPWRCRRTDGKKWRCGKEAYPDSKYCERHMHRGRNRSRKPVESSPSTLSSTISTLTPLASSLSNPVHLDSLSPSLSSSSSSTVTTSFHSGNTGTSGTGTGMQAFCLGGTQLRAGTGATYTDRYVYGLKSGSAEHRFFTEPSGSTVPFDSSLTAISATKYSNSLNATNYCYVEPMQDLGQVVTISSLGQESQKQHGNNNHNNSSFIGFGFGSDEPVKAESNQMLRPFFDEWPKNGRDPPWIQLDDEKSNRTRLSISTPSLGSDESPSDD